MKHRKQGEQGYVLVLVLGTILMVAAMATMTMSLTVSEVTQSGGNQMIARVRAAAEAGQNDSLFYMTNAGLTDVNVTLSPYADAFAAGSQNASVSPIIPSNKYATIIDNLNKMSGTTVAGSVNTVAYTSTVKYVSMKVDEKTFSTAGQTYVLNYNVASTGTLGTFVRSVSTNGQMQIRMGRKFINQFVLLANDGGSQEGNFFANGMNYDGPVQVNQNWRFAGKPQFKYGATTAATTVQMSATCNPSTSAMTNVSSQYLGCTAPDWGGSGLTYAAPKIDLPVNALSQQNAALGLDPKSTATVTNAQECVQLKIVSCTSSGAPEGVYIPTDLTGNITGGIYIKGDAKNISMSVSGNTQLYSITDKNGIVSNIMVNYSTNTTTVVKNGTTTVLKGVISGESKGAGQANGMIYSTGSVLALNGPNRTAVPVANPVPAVPDPNSVPPAVAANSVINIAAASKITVQNDVTYEQDPRTVSSAKNVLGLMAGTGSVSIGTDAPNDVYLQAALLAGTTNQGFAVDNYNSGGYRGQIHLLGSLAEDKEPPRGQAAFVNGSIVVQQGYGDAFNFDPRFLNGGAVPPFFPATNKFTAQSVWPSQQGWQEQ